MHFDNTFFAQNNRIIMITKLTLFKKTADVENSISRYCFIIYDLNVLSEVQCSNPTRDHIQTLQLTDF